MTLAHPDRIEHGRLRRQADYFFSTGAAGRSEIREFVCELAKIGRVAAIGGLLRDLYLEGTRRFSSDVDLVVHPASVGDFDRFIRRFGPSARANRFGGYSIALSRWSFDVWALQRTWADVEGYRQVRQLEDCLTTTFFDWDAALFFPTTKQLSTEVDYFAKVKNRVLNINLEPNPNPLGNSVRALRYARRWDARFGSSLAIFVLKQIVDVGWDRLVSYEEASFRNAFLNGLDKNAVCRALARAESAGESDVVELSTVPTYPR